MRLHHELTVAAPLARVCEVFGDAERLGGCLPDVDARAARGDGLFRWRMEIAAVAYSGSLRLVESDEDASTTVMSLKAHEVGGRGAAPATIATSLHADGDGATRIEVDTDLHVTGREDELPASAADAAMAEILAQVVGGIEQSIAAARSAAARRSVPLGAAASPAAADRGVAVGAAASPPAARRSVPLGAAASPAVDASRSAGGGAASRATASPSIRDHARSPRRFLPALAAAAALAIVLGAVRRRRR